MKWGDAIGEGANGNTRGKQNNTGAARFAGCVCSYEDTPLQSPNSGLFCTKGSF
jgi:hypothetical protein